MNVYDHAVTIVVVCYNSADILEWQALGSANAPFLVVDNASRDQTAEVARSLGHRVVRLDENIGFGQGAMVGLAQVKTPLALILNPDARIDAASLDALLIAAKTYRDCSLFVPRLVDEAGHQHFRHESMIEPRVPSRTLPQGDCPVTMISGAAMLVRVDAFTALGGFDPQIFLYFEDDDVAFQYRAANQTMMHIEGAEVVHIGNTSSGDEEAANQIKDTNFGWSLGYLQTKHGRGASAWALIGMRLRFCRYLITKRGARAARERGRIEGYRQFLRGSRAPGK